NRYRDILTFHVLMDLPHQRGLPKFSTLTLKFTQDIKNYIQKRSDGLKGVQFRWFRSLAYFDDFTASSMDGLNGFVS
ncbi:hypothetical protein AB4486_27505, partial [Vibrio sp. 10N.222.55.C6]|uniref:hypothetical protein n=1 Tax=Vibrio sp. 10N.222.55.C6 TaxID=3229649 RepID=UPI0035512D1C